MWISPRENVRNVLFMDLRIGLYHDEWFGWFCPVFDIYAFSVMAWGFFKEESENMITKKCPPGSVQLFADHLPLQSK